MEFALPLALGVLLALGTECLAQFAPLVTGVGAVVSPGAPGPLFPLAAEWRTIVAGDADTSPPDSTFMAARLYGSGRVVAFGHDGIFTASGYAPLDNGQLLRNTVAWLDSTGVKQIGYTSGHAEWIGGAELNPLRSAMSASGFSFVAVPAPLTAVGLAGKSVIIVGNAWGAFSADEIEALRQFVVDGGGLCLVGLGWSWEPYNPGKTMDDYPMTQLAAPYGMWWQREVFYDPTDRYNGDPRFHVLYPQAFTPSISGAMQTLSAAHAAEGNSLPAALENDTALRVSVTRAHSVLAVVGRELSETHSARNEVFDFYTGLMAQWPAYYSRSGGINIALYPTTVITRERSWVTLRDLLPLTPERTGRLVSTAHLFGRYRDLVEDFGIVLLDNVSSSTAQLDYLHRILTLIPGNLHNLRSISIYEFLQTASFPNVPGYLTRQPGSVNIFGIDIETLNENSFPVEVPPGLISTFCAAVAHEFNHVVEAFHILGDATLSARQTQLIGQAGPNHLNYLRSMFDDGTFTAAPQEFFASIANAWFTDSAKTLELGVRRFQDGRPEPLNQAIFFAGVYSRGGSNRWFYFTDTHGAIVRRQVPLTRDANGHINSLAVGSRTYTFATDASGNVTGLAVANPATQAINVWPDPATVREGRAGVVLVRLATAPENSVAVNVARISGDTDLAVNGNGTLTFTPANWNFPQAVALVAAPDADLTNSSATFAATSAGLPSLTFTVEELDDDLPAITLSPALETGYATLTYQHDKALSDLSYFVEVSSDLSIWNADPSLTVQTVVADNSLVQTRKARFLQLLAPGGKVFLRLHLRR